MTNLSEMVNSTSRDGPDVTYYTILLLYPIPPTMDISKYSNTSYILNKKYNYRDGPNMP